MGLSRILNRNQMLNGAPDMWIIILFIQSIRRRKDIDADMDDFDLVDTIAPQALRAYVEARGWKKTEPFGDLGASYSLGDGGVEVFVPTSRRLADFDIRTWEAAGEIAEVEKRCRREVLRDLLFYDEDGAQARLPRSDTDYRVTIDQIGRLERALLSVRESQVGHPDTIDIIARIQYQEIVRLRAELDAALGFDNGASQPDAALDDSDSTQDRLPKTESDGAK